MKKMYLTFIFFAFCGFFAFGDTDMQEEVDFLLFSPNSGNRFENEEQAFIQLNNLAKYLSNKNIRPGQIIVYGYSAYAPNEIKSSDLSIERALTVMYELQKRGISEELFADPVGYGAVYLWGNNDDENTRKLNRRVRVLLNDESPIPITQEIINAETAPPKVKTTNPIIVQKEPAARKNKHIKSSLPFPWLLLLVLAVFLLLFLLLLGKRSRKSVNNEETAELETRFSQLNTVSKFTPAAKTAMTTYTVNLDEEIRTRAYELYQQRCACWRDGNGDYREQDWYKAVHEISTWYTACGYSVFIDGGCWWAARSFS